MTSNEIPLSERILDSLRARCLQVTIPPSKTLILPNGKQMLFLAPDNHDVRQPLSLQYMNISEDGAKWKPACDFSSISASNLKMSKEQELLRERKRTTSHGISDYSYHQQSNQITFQYGPHFVLAQLPKEITGANSIKAIKLGDPLMDDSGARMDANLTPDGQWVVFARNDDLWFTTAHPHMLADKMQPPEIRLTFAQTISKDLTAGVADFINQEEFDRFTGYWISPNTRDYQSNNIKYREYSVLYLEADNTEVPTVTIPCLDGVEHHKWPRAGENNCKFKVKVVRFSVPLSSIIQSNTNTINNINTNNIILQYLILKQSIYVSYDWIEYIIRVGWTTRDNECWIQFLDRSQMKTSVVLFNIMNDFKISDDDENKDDDEHDGNASGLILLETEGSPWINYHDCYLFIDGGFLWASEHSGWRHLYFIPYPNQQNTNGKTIECKMDDKNMDCTKVNMRFNTPLINDSSVIALTAGEWGMETSAIHFNPKTRMIYFIARKETPLESHMYSVHLDKPLVIQRLTKLGYYHHSHIADSLHYQYFTTIYSSVEERRRLAIISLVDASVVKEFEIPMRCRPPKYIQYCIPKIVQITNSNDGISVDMNTFHAVIYPAYDLQKRKGGYPTIIYVYGGPHVQLVTNQYDRITGNSKYQMWRTMGYTVAFMDGRGSHFRGLAFEGCMKYSMGQIEIQDQVRLVEYLVENGFTDAKRVGIIGSSYGGYLTLMALCQRPDVFKIGIASAPVTDWKLYDTGYTERYMGEPVKQPDGYKMGSVLHYCKQFPGEENRVVIAHGLGDENVHFVHTAKLIEAMIGNEKPYVLKIFPSERHGLRKYPSVLYMEKLYCNHFAKYL